MTLQGTASFLPGNADFLPGADGALWSLDWFYDPPPSDPRAPFLLLGLFCARIVGRGN